MRAHRLVCLSLTLLAAVAVTHLPRRAEGQAVTLPLGSLRPSKVVPSGTEFFKGARYVGSKPCQQCHAKQYEEWQTTWHAKMIRRPSADVVVGDFDDVRHTFPKVEADRVDGKGVAPIDASVRLWTRDGKYHFTLLECHNPGNRLGGFDVTGHRAIMATGDHAPNVIHGNPDASLLVLKLRGTQPVGVRMPIDAPPLSDGEIQLIVDWVKTGAFPDVGEREE